MAAAAGGRTRPSPDTHSSRCFFFSLQADSLADLLLPPFNPPSLRVMKPRPQHLLVLFTIANIRVRSFLIWGVTCGSSSLFFQVDAKRTKNQHDEFSVGISCGVYDRCLQTYDAFVRACGPSDEEKVRAVVMRSRFLRHSLVCLLV